jgi:hypothetical protein
MPIMLGMLMPADVSHATLTCAQYANPSAKEEDKECLAKSNVKTSFSV